MSNPINVGTVSPATLGKLWGTGESQEGRGVVGEGGGGGAFPALGWLLELKVNLLGELSPLPSPCIVGSSLDVRTEDAVVLHNGLPAACTKTYWVFVSRLMKAPFCLHMCLSGGSAQTMLRAVILRQRFSPSVSLPTPGRPVLALTP